MNEWEFKKKQNICMFLLYQPAKYLSTTKRKLVNLHLRNVVDSTSIKTWKLTSLISAQFDIYFLLQYCFCQKGIFLNPIVRKQYIHPNWGTFYKIIGISSSKMSILWKTWLRNLSRLKDKKRRAPVLNIMSDMDILFCYKWPYWGNE